MKKELSIAPKLKEMKNDETTSFPIKKFSSVKNACCNYAMRYERKFSTRLNRKKGVIEVTRIF